MLHSNAYPTVRLAEDAIAGAGGIEAIKRELVQPDSGSWTGVDLFAPIADIERQAPEFRYLRDGFNQSAARDLLRALQPWIEDLDGNLVKDFQSTGYSARVWEIYLRFAFLEMNLEIGRDHDVPDFELIRGDARVLVEATTVNASGGGRGAGLRRGAPPPRPDDIMHYLEHVMPLRFGSPLHSKMKKRYWEAEHVKGNPFVLAIADFHESASMIWSHTALPIYLYGRSAEVVRDEDGAVIGGVEKIVAGFERKAERILPFFEQEGTEHVSAVLCSNAGTIGKFNRMGARAGFGDRFIALRRSGARHVPGPDAFEPLPFEEDVEAGTSVEGWSDELVMYHNPKALAPVDEGLFPGITHYRVEGEAVWSGDSYRVLYSSTLTFDMAGRDQSLDDFLPKDESAAPKKRTGKSKR
ncbi:MAG: hypothetical protein JWR80_1600 [Bradyrhizobium sp.]|nr:hypothetical protein [Bradyrhizobium sp.]